MCIVRQGVAGLLQDFIGVAGIVLRHHADVGGHHMAPEFQRQVDDPLGLFDFARVLIRAGEPMTPEVAAQGGNRQTVTGQQRLFLRDLRGRQVFRRHFAAHGVKLDTVRAHVGAGFQAFFKGKAEPVGDDADRKFAHVVNPFLKSRIRRSPVHPPIRRAFEWPRGLRPAPP